MFKNRILLVLGIVSLLLVSMVVSSFRSAASTSTTEAASDFHQRHPDWTWSANRQNAIIPMTGDAAFPDFHQRHPELSAPAGTSIDLTDYYFRHPELSGASNTNVDLTDYYFRHLNN